MDDTCVICGAYVPEGRLVCPACERMNGCTSYEQANTAQYQRQSGWKEPPEPYCPIHTRYVSITLKSPDTASYKGKVYNRVKFQGGGDIQAVYPFEDPVAIIVNDEGKNIGLPPNRVLRDENGRIYDILPGNALIVGLGEENFTDLSPELMNKYSEYFKVPEQFWNKGGKIIVTKCPVPVEHHRAKPRRSFDWDVR